MPGRQTVTFRGLEIRVGPAFWLRRLFRFPFYFESTNPNFRIEVKKVAEPLPEEEWPDGKILIQVAFADNTYTVTDFQVPDLKIGQSDHFNLGRLYTSYPGQTIIRLIIKPKTITKGEEWRSLYSYQVRPEEQLWLAAFGPLLGLLFGIGTMALGVFIQRSLD